MLRPEQMSKISVTGAKSVMDEVIETMHDLHIVHITDYDGSWEGFEPGDSLEGADETSGKLVTVRAIESILDISEEDVPTTTTVDLSNAEERLETIRQRVNELDDRRDDLRSRQRDLEDRIDQMQAFADLGLDLELLWGYDSLEVLVGEGSAEEIETSLAEADGIDGFEVFAGTDSVGVFAREIEDGALDDAMVGVQFTEYEVPEESGDPEAKVSNLEHELEAKVENELGKVENELESLKLEHAGFLLALEEQLSIEAQKYESPLYFATTERSFIVEGWVPTEKYDRFASTLDEAVGNRVEIDEIERAEYTSGGHLHQEEVHDEEQAETATDGGEKQVATDGGPSREIVTVGDDPPVVQKNSRIISPFELLVRAVNRPKYSEFDPTMLVFLTFPFFFGFMIGDVGYGALYVLIGYWLYSRFDKESFMDLGMIIVWLGVFTILFGVLYGELFGLHVFYWLWEPLGHGGELLPKGLVAEEWAITWLIVAVIFGWIQLNIGYVFDFVEEYQVHGLKPAVIESGSWLLMLNGIWVWIFSKHLGGHTGGPKPEFLVGPDAYLNQETLQLGFTGFPEWVGILGLVAFGLGIVLLLTGPWYEVFEFAVPLVHVLSYTRLTAVLLSKAGMAVAANMLYFGAYMDDGFQFMYSIRPDEAPVEPIFSGISNMGTEVSILGLELGVEGALLGIPVLIAGHLVVLAIGGTAAIQAIRLEFFEFFEKFYEGGGKNYEPFGYDREYTTDN